MPNTWASYSNPDSRSSPAANFPRKSARKMAAGLKRLIRWPVRITYWGIMGFFAISILAGLRSLLPAGVPASRDDPASAALSKLEIASAGLTAEEIEQAVISSVEAMLPPESKSFPIEDLPAVLAQTRAGARPFLLFFYCSLEEPLFAVPDGTR